MNCSAGSGGARTPCARPGRHTRRGPDEYAFADLMREVPAAGRARWRARALDAADKADLESALRIFLAQKEPARLAERLRAAKPAELERVSHYVLEPAAKQLQKRDPTLAGRAHAAMGFRIVEAKKSRYYAAALDNFRAAKRWLEKAGATAEWKKVVARVRKHHARKSGFIGDFEDIVAPTKAAPPTQSFLERARRSFSGEHR